MARLSEGKKVGEWTCLHPLGDGGNADVWEVVHEDGQHGAMKVVRDQRPDKTAYARFTREIETLRTLTPREGVVGVLDDHLPEEPSNKDFAWLVMPVAELLAKALEGKQIADVAAAVADIADVLADLHDAGLAHRDVKPDNLYWHEGRAAVGDFGLVELPDVASLNDGRIPGAFGFIADEVLEYPIESDGAPADVFALAKTLWVLLVDGQDFPPQGHIPADAGAATLSRRLVIPGADTLDQVIDRATAPVQIRLTMREFAAELRAWAAEPSARELPDGIEEALALARGAMQNTFSDRDAEQAREAAWTAAYETLRRRSDELMQILAQLDAAVEIGPYANDFLHKYTEVSTHMGSARLEHQEHWGGKVAKGSSSQEIVLLVDFGIAIDETGTVHIAGFALAGRERTAGGGGYHHGPISKEVPMGTIQLEQAIDEVVGQISEHMPRLLEAFARQG